MSEKCCLGTTVSMHNEDDEDDENDYEEDDINPRHERLSLGPKIYGPLRTTLRAGCSLQTDPELPDRPAPVKK